MEKQNAIEALERLQYRIQDLSREELLAIGMAVSEIKKCAEAARALSNANEPADRCSTCENNGKPICSSCIMTGHGNDIDFYRAAADAGKGENG